MIRHRLLIGWLGWLTSLDAQADHQDIEDAEFIIEKQKENKVEPQKKIQFKAPLPSHPSDETQKIDPPKPTLEQLRLLPISPMLHHFRQLNPEYTPKNSHLHAAKLGLSSLTWRPYLAYVGNYFSKKKLHWSSFAVFIPTATHQKWQTGAGGIKCTLTKDHWLFEPKLLYQNHHHAKSNHHSPLFLTQTIHHIGGQVRLQYTKNSHAQAGSFHYSHVGYHGHPIKENVLIARHKWTYNRSPYLFKVTTYADISHYTHTKQQTERWITSIKPCLHTNIKQLHLKISTELSYHNQPINNLSSLNFYPQIKLHQPIKSWLNPYLNLGGLGVGGCIRPLHLNQLVRKNPWLIPTHSTTTELQHSYQYFTLKLGSKGTLAQGLTYQAQMGYKRSQNRSHITQNHENYQLHPYVGNCNRLKSHLSIAYHPPKVNLQIGLKTQVAYHLNHEKSTPCNHTKPRFTCKPILQYGPHDKLAISAKGDFSRIYLEQKGKNLVTSYPLHLDIMVEYMATEKWATWLQITNLFNQKGTTYTGYPEKKRNITFGLQYKW